MNLQTECTVEGFESAWREALTGCLKFGRGSLLRAYQVNRVAVVAVVARYPPVRDVLASYFLLNMYDVTMSFERIASSYKNGR